MKAKGLFPSIILLLSAIYQLPSEPFTYRYEITANSNSVKDLWELYDVKEKVIELYDEKYLNDQKKEQRLFQTISEFAITDRCRPYYVSGVLVILIGEAKGICIEGNLKQNICDDTIIHEKIYLFDLFR